ncbi:MAG: class II fumarate hydratase [Candidatus Thorarchaeota archaeon]|nr:class II fumarate hydratase [Candidatus Thorarchaeota archaeon]
MEDTTVDKTRREKDSIGELDIPANVYWGINTQRALMNFQISGRTFPVEFIHALAQVKKACLAANKEAKLIRQDIFDAIEKAIDEVLDGKHSDQFPIDIFQTGSGTQTNMNMNEVLSNRANEILGHPRGSNSPVHPNNTVNMSQSSNDVIPTAMHVSVLTMFKTHLFPALAFLKNTLDKKIEEFSTIVKVGRTHLQDAVPISLSTEFEVYRSQIETFISKDLSIASETLTILPIGGTALGTGLNAPADFGEHAAKELRKMTGYDFSVNPVKAEGISSHKAIVRASAALRNIALTCMKLANDVRWMGSGPRAGLGELILPANEPGSSIMPGKINPTQSEALIQVCLQVIGNDTTIAAAEGFGSILDLNVAKPVMIVNLLDSIQFLSNGIDSFTKNCLAGIKANEERIKKELDRSLMVVTRLSPFIGYDKAAEIAKTAHSTGKTIREVVLESGLKIDGDLDDILDPTKMV